LFTYTYKINSHNKYKKENESQDFRITVSSEWSDSENADNDKIDGSKDSSTSESVVNNSMNYQNEICDAQLKKEVNLEFTPGFIGKQSERGLTGLLPFECFSKCFALKICGGAHGSIVG
jgi:hypothetical protein